MNVFVPVLGKLHTSKESQAKLSCLLGTPWTLCGQALTGNCGAVALVTPKGKASATSAPRGTTASFAVIKLRLYVEESWSLSGRGQS